VLEEDAAGNGDRPRGLSSVWPPVSPWRPAYMPSDMAGWNSLVCVVSLSFIVLCGQIQASTDQDHRLIPRCELPATWSMVFACAGA
jgi:hypothetical protein